MEKTQIADYIGKPDNAYALLALLSENAQRIVSRVLRALKDDIGEGLWTIVRLPI
jgi:hypothetical protein